MNNTRHLYTREAGLLLPLGMSGITGGLLGSIVLTVYIWQGWRDGFAVGFMVALVTTFITWLMLVRHWLVSTVETITGVDIDQDGYIGEAPQEAPQARHTVKVDVWEEKSRGYPEMNTSVLPFSEGDMQALAVGLLSGKPFTEREWTGQGKPLSMNQFREARAVMIARGLVEMVNPKSPQQGYKLSRAGSATMRHFATTSPTPGGYTREN
jgi:hypothetical protein